MFQTYVWVSTLNSRLPLAQLVLLQSKASFHIASTQHANKNAASARSQAKVFGKFFGQRVTGSKKRWYPTAETNAVMEKSAVVFSMNKVGVPPKKQGKNTLRRMAVLNKLFMEHISDLLATSTAAVKIQGRGLQVTQVKITSDFSIVNVYWMGSGDPAADLDLEAELQRCSGLLRHELSQLYLMGQVPRINFVRDRVTMSATEVDAILRTIDFGEDYVEQDLADEVKIDFKWKTLESNVVAPQHDKMKLVADNNAAEQEAVLESLPEMRHDVLGLDHRHIILKIHTKMRKSKQAWELHEKGELQKGATVNLPEATEEETVEETSSQSSLERINEQLSNAAAIEEKFGKFLAKRRERKAKSVRSSDLEHEKLVDLSAPNALLDELQRSNHEDEDFIEEEDSTEKKS